MIPQTWPLSFMRRSGAGGAAPSMFGALVRKSGAQTLAFSPSNEVLTFGTEVYDETGWHSTAGNTSRLTVQSGVSLVRVTSNLLTSGSWHMLHLKGGSTFAGMGRADSDSTGNQVVNMTSAPIAVSATDYFETAVDGTGTVSDPTTDEETWFAIEKLDSATKYALVGKTAGQAIGAGAFTTLTWDAESVDTDGFHDNASNNSRLTVPSGVSLVRICANVKGGSVTGQLVVSPLKNGGSARGLPGRDVDTATAEHVNVISAPMVVSPGDYFEVQVFLTSASTVPNGNDVWFSIEEVPSTIKRALAYKSASQSCTGGAAATLAWGAEEYDTDSIHDNTTNNSRLTVPAGCTKARPSFSLRTGSTADQMFARVRKNGSDYYGMPAFDTDTAGADLLNALGAWVDVVPGDYFEVIFSPTTTTTISTDNDTWFCLECQ